MALSNAGADVAGIDIAGPVGPILDYQPATVEDLRHTGELVKAAGGRWTQQVADQRNIDQVSKAAQATLVGDVFDDAATGQGLLNYFLRGLGCGALSEDEVLATGLTLEELRTRSFVRIVEGRRVIRAKHGSS